MPRPGEDRSDVGGAAQFNNIGPVPLSASVPLSRIGPVPLSAVPLSLPVPLSVYGQRVNGGLRREAGGEDPRHPSVFAYQHRTGVERIAGQRHRRRIPGRRKQIQGPPLHSRAIERWPKFTLLKAGTSSCDSTTKYSAFFIIAGKHTTDAETLKLTSVSFYCNHRIRSSARDFFSMEQEGEKEHLKSVTIKYVQPDMLSWRIDEIAATLNLQTGVTSKSGRMNRELHARSFVTHPTHAPGTRLVHQASVAVLRPSHTCNRRGCFTDRLDG